MRTRAQAPKLVLFTVAVLAASCSSSRRSGAPGPTTTHVDGASPGMDGAVGRDGSALNGCDAVNGSADLDQDGDGFSRAAGDCNDCDAAVNPGAFDFPGNGADEDCSSEDAVASELLCDSGLSMNSTDAKDAARAIGLCKFTSESSKEWGVISARFTRASGSGAPSHDRQFGLLPDFGQADPQVGESMLALSSGMARSPTQSGFTSECDCYDDYCQIAPIPSTDSFPPGFPVESPSCPGVTSGDVFDPVALEVKVRVPTNAKALSFNSNFYTYEYPNYICSEYNDFFVTLLTPRVSSLKNDNIVFDSEGNLVSVNSGLLQVCEAGTHNGKAFSCEEGVASLEGSGFEKEYECGQTLEFPVPADRAATGWLQTKAPIESGSVITLRFAIWDSGDPFLDSTVLIDGFEWEVEEATVGTTPVLR